MSINVLIRELSIGTGRGGRPGPFSWPAASRRGKGCGQRPGRRGAGQALSPGGFGRSHLAGGKLMRGVNLGLGRTPVLPAHGHDDAAPAAPLSSASPW